MLRSVASSQIFHRILRDEIRPSHGIVGGIRLHGFTQFQRSVFYYASTGTWIPLQGIGPTQYCKVRQADLIRIAVDEGWHSKVIGFYRLVTDLKLKVAAIINLRPLQLAIVLNQIIARIIGFGQSNVLTIR